VIVTPQSPEDEDKAPILEAVINQIIEDSDGERQLRRILLDALVTDQGWGKVGYHSEFGFRRDQVDYRRSRKKDIEFHEYVHAERAFFKRVSPFNIILDPMANGPEDARWIAERFVRPLEVLQNDRRMVNTHALTPGRMFMGTDDLGDEEQWSRWDGRMIDSAIFQKPTAHASVDIPIEYYLVWDKVQKKIFTLQESLTGWFSTPRKWDFNVGGLPYEQLRPFDVPEEQNGTSITEQLSWHQYEYNALRRFQIDMVKRLNPKLLVRKRAMSNNDVGKLKRGVPGAVVFVDDPSRDVKESPLPRIPPDAYAVLGGLLNEMHLITGISAPNIGGQRPGANRVTATENLREERGFQVRIDDVASSVEMFGTRIGEKIGSVVTSLYTTRDYVRVSGPMGAALVPYIGVALAGRYRFSSRMGSTTPNSEAIRRKQVLDALAILSQFPDLINRRELVLRVLRLFPEIGRDTGKLLLTPQQIQGQAMQQLQANPQMLLGGGNGTARPGVNAPASVRQGVQTGTPQRSDASTASRMYS
jgi:hypothetical protein